MNTDAHQLIREALEKQLGQKYKIKKLLGEGATALVYLITQKDLRIERVVKVLKEKEYADLFMNEVHHMAELTHENVISILETGAIVMRKGGEKTIIPYYIMEYLSGAEEFEKFLRKNERNIEQKTLLNLFGQILSGLHYIHRSKILHLDIKEENIFVGRGNRVKIADFGFSVRVRGKETTKYTKIRGTSENWPDIVKNKARKIKKGSNPARAYAEIPNYLLTEMLDIHALGKVFSRTLTKEGIKEKFKKPDLEYLSLMRDKMIADSEHGSKYKSVAEIIDDLSKLDKYFTPVVNLPELSYIPKTGIIRVPELRGVPFTARVRAIVDHPWFQRLRNAKQMGFAYLVYPGAVHTRFEHSLGVYYNAIRYITSLLADPRTPFFKQVVTEEEILSILVSALLHDIGQHTFSHSLEELTDLATPHESYSPLILSGEIGAFFRGLPKPDKTFVRILKEAWGISNPKFVLYIISKGKTSAKGLPGHKKILRSIVDGPIDADKMDYLERDSLHSGVPYGRALDQGRFLQALTVNDKDRDGISFTEKGRISAELFYISRSHMFAEVYWHHAVRSFSGMLNAAVVRFIENKSGKQREIDEFKRAIFIRPEWEVVNFLFEKGPRPTKEIIELIRRRIPYKRLYVVKQSESDRYDQLGRIRDKGHETFHRFSRKLVEGINVEFSKHYPSHYFFLDVPNTAKNRLGTVCIIDEESGTPVNFFEKSALWQGNEKDWHRWVRKIRLFCHPIAYSYFEQLNYDYHQILSGILENLCAEKEFKF